MSKEFKVILCDNYGEFEARVVNKHKISGYLQLTVIDRIPSYEDTFAVVESGELKDKRSDIRGVPFTISDKEVIKEILTNHKKSLTT